MATGIFLGVNSLSKKMKSGYIGVNGVARKINKIYIGVGNVARLGWQSMITKINKWIHCLLRSKIRYSYSSGINIDMITNGIKLDENTVLANASIRDSYAGEHRGYLLLKITFDNNSNITSLSNKYIGENLNAKCVFGNYYAAAYTSTFQYTQSILTCGLFDDMYWASVNIPSRVIDMYSLNNNQVYGAFYSSTGEQLFVATYNGVGNPTYKTKTFINKDVTITRIIKISGNKNLLFYTQNNVIYVTVLTFNSLDSFYYGTPVVLDRNWSNVSLDSNFIIDDNHVIIYSQYTQGYVHGIYIKDDIISISNEIGINAQKICRIGKSTSFFVAPQSYNMINDGSIIYYDVSSNTVSLHKSSITAQNFNLSGEYVNLSYSIIIPAGEKGMAMFNGSNSEYVKSFDFMFDV